VPDIVADTLGALVSDLSTLLGSRAEARDLVAALLDRPRSWPTVHAAEPISSDLLDRATIAARKRRAGAPLAYAVGYAAFRHLTLRVDERVLIPRPETEVLVDLVLAECRTGTVVDLGTGSGAIALSLAAEGGFSRILGTDISGDALEVASVNARAVGARINPEWRQGSWLAPVLGTGIRAQAVVSNPPYISYEEARSLEPSVRDWEPPIALLSAENGMSALRTIIRGAPEILDAGGLLALEVDARRASIAAELLLSDGRYADVRVRLDLAGRERFVLARHLGIAR
jgi:release factor glutamine methyltransferase